MQTRNSCGRHLYFDMRVMGALVAMAACWSGCTTTEVVTKALGVQGPYLFYGFDSIARPHEPAEIVVRLQKGPYLNDEEGVLVRFERDGQFVALSRTDDEGYARATFTADQPGNYTLSAHVLEGQLSGRTPEPAPVFVCLREAGEKIIVVDIDKTLVASSFDGVRAGTAKPMPGSQRVLERLAEDKRMTAAINCRIFANASVKRPKRPLRPPADAPAPPVLRPRNTPKASPTPPKSILLPQR